MILGMTLSTFTLVHVVISLVGIATGLIVVYGLITGKRFDAWTAIFLLFTVLTSLTGFLFPFTHLLPSHVVGILSLLVLAVAIFARYPRRLEGAWRRIYVICAMVALYLNCFVLGSANVPQGACSARIGSKRERAAIPHRSAGAPGYFCLADHCRGQAVWLLHCRRPPFTLGDRQSGWDDVYPQARRQRCWQANCIWRTDPQLVAEDLRAQELLFRFNMTRPGAGR